MSFSCSAILFLIFASLLGRRDESDDLREGPPVGSLLNLPERLPEALLSGWREDCGFSLEANGGKDLL